MSLGESDTSSNYTVLARRYRPGRFEECIGQEHVAQALRNAIQAGRVAHAYLFTGTRGVGKTSMARIFAKALNCAKGPTADPCGECESCAAIAAGSDLDVVEIDGASNRGIDEIRELRQGVAFRPSRSRYKIYIIDEVHMLSKDAFNALLKTLEEPPAHVKFVFATTEAQKIPITILSRCQRYDFAGIGMAQIENRLKEIVATEGMTADDEAVEVIARRARGSMRDSQSLLDQVLAFAGGHLTADMVHQLLGTAGDQRVADLAAAILGCDAARCLSLVETAVAEGVQLGEWIEQTLDYFRDLLVLSIDENATVLSVPSRLRESMAEQSRRLSPERVMEMMDILAACRTRMRTTSFGRTLVEMTLVRLCRLDNFLSVAEIPAVASPGSPPSAQAGMPGPTSLAAPKKNAQPVDPVAPTEMSNGAAPPPSQSAVPASATPAVEHDLSESTIRAFWSSVTGSIVDTFLAAMLEQASKVTYSPPSTIVVEFPANAATSKRQCEERGEKIRQICEQLAGRRVNLSFEQSRESPQTPPQSAARSQLQLREEAMRDPLVRQAEDLLGARIVGEILASSATKRADKADSIEDDV